MFLFVQLDCINAHAQLETKPIQRRNQRGEIEEFSVLKSNHDVKQGTYARYRPPGPFPGMLNVVMLEVGQYENGLKEGEWRYFSESHGINKLASKGIYHAGVEEGQWYFYHRQYNTYASKAMVPNSSAKRGYLVNIDDSTAVVQAQGFYTQGVRVGIWKYYNEASVMEQAVNHSVNKLVYWAPGSGPAQTGAALLLNHPLLYLGGKQQMVVAALKAIDLARFGLAAPTGTAEYAFSVDSAGVQTGIRLVNSEKPTQYEQLMLTKLGKLLIDGWLPRIIDGKAVASEYHLQVEVSKPEPNKTLLRVMPLEE